jgi:hypothetical protein
VRISQTGGGIRVRASGIPRDEFETIIKLELDRPSDGIPPLRVGANTLPDREKISVRLTRPADPRYAARGASSLIDGERGSTDRTDGAWLGLEGTDFEASFDFHAPRKISRVTLGCLQEQVSRVFFPTMIEVSVAGEDSVFHVAGKIETGTPKEDAEIRSADFSVVFEPAIARFLRLRAVNPGICPAWHPLAGQKAWVLVDESIIE